MLLCALEIQGNKNFISNHRNAFKNKKLRFNKLEMTNNDIEC